MRPARIISLWLTTSASAGASLSVERKKCETRISGRFGQKPLFYRSLALDPTNPEMTLLPKWRVRKPADDAETVYVSERFGVRSLHIGSDTIQSSMRLARPIEL